jgi:hypothetical protein
MKSLAQAPASTLRWWGTKSAPAFDFISGFFNEEGIKGPVTWREGALVPYSKELCPTIRTSVSVSTFSAANDYAKFDCAAVIFSKSIHDLSHDAGPEGEVFRNSKTFPGFTPCLTVHLAHLKWCQQPTDINPSWAMSLEDDTSVPNARAFAEDFKSLMTPLLDGLKSDEDLKVLLTRALRRSKPHWVKSDTPWFVRLPFMVEILGGCPPTYL